jgi:hypothetical protein
MVRVSLGFVESNVQIIVFTSCLLLTIALLFTPTFF